MNFTEKKNDYIYCLLYIRDILEYWSVPVRLSRMLYDDVTPSFPIIGIVKWYAQCGKQIHIAFSRRYQHVQVESSVLTKIL